jgi:hypothetical protein
VGKQRTIERIRAGEDTIGMSEQGVVHIFEEHYRLSLKSMTPEHAAATAHDAVQRHLASVREAKAGEPM